ncbi:MAG: DUF924 family protein [Neisseria sp.]|nr:DUF924 family protein [Neisseria sp.]
MNYQSVLDFWFKQTPKENWFSKNADFDAQIRQQFFATWQAAAAGELAHWRHNLHGRLAEIIVLDQFSRNLFRDSVQAFAQDGMALVLAQEAIAQADFAKMELSERHFMLMPLMHSESRLIHSQAVELFKKYTNDYALDFELQHQAIIERFGRYPHRNVVLKRTSTSEEIEFLKQDGSAF